MGIGTTVPDAAITLKNGEVQQGYFSDFTVARMKHMPPSAEAPSGVGEPGCRRSRQQLRTLSRLSQARSRASCRSSWRNLTQH